MRIIEKASALSELGSEMIACRKHKIFNVQIFATNRCNSRCRICSIWKNMPKEDIDIKIIKDIISAKSVEKNAIYDLIGGEFILHPKAEEIIETLNRKKKRYELFSNCILAEKLIKIVKDCSVPKLIISLDGNRSTYKNVRGVDNYENVIRVIRELKDDTKILISYVINPLNSREDFLHVKKIAERYGIGLGVNFYDRRAIFGTTLPEGRNYDLRDVHDGNYADSFYLWEKGALKLPCFRVRTFLTVMQNGDVPLCQFKNNILGNLHKQRLDDIWKNALEKQSAEKDCNGCWLSCYRGFDNNMCRLLNTFLPKSVLRKYVGDYTWDKIGRIF